MSWDSAESVAGEAPPGSPVLGFMHLQPQRPGVPAPSCGSGATALTCGFPVLSAGVMKCHTEREDGGWARAGKDGRAHGLSSGSAPEPVLSGPYAGASSQAGRDRGLSKSDAGRRREAGREQSRCASPRGAVRISASGRPPPGADRDGTSMSHAVSLSCAVFATRRLGTCPAPTFLGTKPRRAGTSLATNAAPFLLQSRAGPTRKPRPQFWTRSWGQGHQPRHRRGVLRKPEGSAPLRKASTTGQSPWQMGSRGTGR